jgi:hypothetical protein
MRWLFLWKLIEAQGRQETAVNMGVGQTQDRMRHLAKENGERMTSSMGRRRLTNIDFQTSYLLFLST